MNKETRELAIHTSLESTTPTTRIVTVHFPFQMRSERCVHIELEPFWEYTCQWAKAQGYPKEEGHYQHCPRREGMLCCRGSRYLVFPLIRKIGAQ